jgi:hypothetical protein
MTITRRKFKGYGWVTMPNGDREWKLSVACIEKVWSGKTAEDGWRRWVMIPHVNGERLRASEAAEMVDAEAYYGGAGMEFGNRPYLRRQTAQYTILEHSGGVDI